MTTSTGWLKTLDGADVFTEDGEWYWSHEQQGWFHAPGLLTAVPAPPMGTRVKDEVKRLKTGWPPFLLIFSWRFAKANRLLTGTLLGHAALVWMWVWKIGIDYGIHNVARSWQMEIYKMYAQATQPPYYNDHGAWYYAEYGDDQYARHLAFSFLFFVITLAIFYSLYVGVATAYDTHKGYALLVPVALLTIAGIVKRNRAAELAHHVRDVRRE